MSTLNSKIAFLLFLVPLPACDGGPSPSGACREAVDILCQRTLACLTAEELASRGIPSDQRACVDLMSARNGCDLLTESNACPDDQVYDADAAAACVDDIAAISCTEIANNDVGPLHAESCADVCGQAGEDRLGEPCTVNDQDACGPANKCGFVLQNPDTGFGDYQCVPDGDRGENAACSAGWDYGDYDDCARGLVCWEEACHAFCDGPIGCDPDQRCVITDAEVAVCADTCSVLAQDCPATQGCYPWTNDYAVCRKSGYSYVCDQHSDCPAGSLCVESYSGDPTCRPTCDAGRYPDQPAPGCSSWEVCRSLSELGSVYNGVGICVDG